MIRFAKAWLYLIWNASCWDSTSWTLTQSFWSFLKMTVLSKVLIWMCLVSSQIRTWNSWVSCCSCKSCWLVTKSNKSLRKSSHLAFFLLIFLHFDMTQVQCATQVSSTDIVLWVARPFLPLSSWLQLWAFILGSGEAEHKCCNNFTI